ncbi:cobalamin-5'-phosphate synthase [Desulfacinum hydrothermale DSM 13146]|uniref:Adenosylcobinamide-GDP ribazoletransferase n=1 Tax=Desulfacinum hydrothermale DSM 13146 TaxID=1121390 RepID=A0A1W1XHX4_9BACT|nr:adenosylcobinamide-GDP ribazoletransferase [Desulfacinum hydrothermale]SMC23585.1 cobalamin-5'-phosphate synthase [Desulfacinum hydrothermale DSM 13146]
MIQGFRTALAFLSRLRLPGGGTAVLEPRDLARSFAFFPAVGLVLGCLQAAAAVGLAALPPALSAIWVLALTTWLTRGLHLDGLADVADGVGGGFDPQRRLAIMKDSRVGAFGVMALVLGLLVKAAALAQLLQGPHLGPLVVVPMISRGAMVWCAYKIPYARSEGGLGKPFVDHVGRREIVWSTATAAGVVALGPWTLWLLAAAALTVWAVRRQSKRWLGGITGDVLGAANEVVEMVGYTLAALLAAT